MKELLKKMKEEGKYVALYLDRNKQTRFNYCCVIGVDDTHFAVRQITEDGEDDGYSVYPIDRLYRINYKDQYEEKMHKLMQSHEILPPIQIPDDCEIMSTMLHKAMDNGRVVRVELDDSGYADLYGIPRKIDKDKCTFEVYDDYGCADGYSILNMSDITQINVADADERRIEQLMKYNVTQ